MFQFYHYRMVKLPTNDEKKREQMHWLKMIQMEIENMCRSWMDVTMSIKGCGSVKLGDPQTHYNASSL